MSTYIRRTKHPATGKFEPATWIDDYFGPHRYGVRFSDGMTLSEDSRDWEFKDDEELTDKTNFCECCEGEINHCYVCSREGEHSTEPRELLPGSDRWNELSMVFHQVRHMESGDGIAFLNKYVKEETL